MLETSYVHLIIERKRFELLGVTAVGKGEMASTHHEYFSTGPYNWYADAL